MATAERSTRTETRTVTEEVTEYTLTLSEDEKVALLDLLAEDNNSRLEDVWYSLRFADAPEASTLKVGDRVRITQYREGNGGYRLAPLVAGKTGTLVIIDDRDDDGLPYNVELDTPLEDYGSLWVHAVERI